MTARCPGRRPRICFVGPMVGIHPGCVPNPMESLAPRLSGMGYETILTSHRLPRLLRWGDMIWTIVRRRGDYDVICLQAYSGPSFVVESSVVAMSRLLDKPIVAVLHGGGFPEFVGRWRRWVETVLGACRCIVTPSPFLARVAENLGYGVRVIPNMVDVEVAPFRPRRHLEPKLLWMRAFAGIYNPEMAIRVAARLRKRHPEAKLMMCGRVTPAVGPLRALARELGVGDAVTFPGFLSGEAKARAFEWADVFLHTNRVDNMPISLLEAFSSGVPVVATRVGGIPDMIEDGRNGILVDDDDDRAMAEAVGRLLDNPDLASTLSTVGREGVVSSTWASVMPLWEAVFEDACASR